MSFAALTHRKAEGKLGYFAEKGSIGGHHARLNRWLGWGFVNFRATCTSGAERVYGAHIFFGMSAKHVDALNKLNLKPSIKETCD